MILKDSQLKPFSNLEIWNYSAMLLLLLLSHFTRVRLLATPWTAARQAPPSLGFSRQEHWSGLPFPSPGDLPDLGTEPRSPALQADSLTSEPPGKSPVGIIYSAIGRLPHSSTLAWKIPWMEEPGGLQSMGSLRVGLNRATSLSLSFSYTLNRLP